MYCIHLPSGIDQPTHKMRVQQYKFMVPLCSGDMAETESKVILNQLNIDHQIYRQ